MNETHFDYFFLYANEVEIRQQNAHIFRISVQCIYQMVCKGLLMKL